MSLVRSIDAVDTGSINLNCPASINTLAVTGPRLQTPKDTSIVLVEVFVSFSAFSAGGTLTLQLFVGTSITNPSVGQFYTDTIATSPQQVFASAMWVVSAAFTDYVQYTLAVKPSPESATLAEAIMKCTSF